MSEVLLAPSILSADFTRLGEQVREAEEGGADWIHVDVMDGRFVPNITMGPQIAAVVRRATSLPVDVHLMIEEPERHLEVFADAGVDRPDGARGDLAAPAPDGSADPGIGSEGRHHAEPQDAPAVDLRGAGRCRPGAHHVGEPRLRWPALHSCQHSADRTGTRGTLCGVGGRRCCSKSMVGSNAVTAPAAVAAGASVLVAGSAVYNTRGSVATNLTLLREAVARAGQA